eukprot:2016420-Rhodomonas_salina.1
MTLLLRGADATAAVVRFTQYCAFCMVLRQQQLWRPSSGQACSTSAGPRDPTSTSEAPNPETESSVRILSPNPEAWEPRVSPSPNPEAELRDLLGT